LTIKSSAGTALASADDNLANANVISVTTATTVTQATAVGEITDVNNDAAVVGEALTLGAITAGETDVSRIGDTYTITADDIRLAANVAAGGVTSTTGGSAVTHDATFQVVVDDTGKAAVTLVDGGSGWAAGDKIVIPETLMGGAGADLAFTIGTVSAVANRTAEVYTVTSDNYTTNSTSGTGAVFTVSIDSATKAAVVQIANGGSGYTTSDTFTIDGSVFGTGDNSDLTFDVNTVADANGTAVTFAEVRTDANAFQSGQSYVIQSLGSTNSSGDITQSDSDAQIIARAFTNEDGTAITGNLSVGQTITMATAGDTIGTTTVTQEHLDAANALIEGMTFTRPTETLTAKIEAVQALLNRARVEAGSQYAAMESAVSYTTDLTAQYELGFNTVNDVNFSAETAHLAKNQILQQAATAMLAQANSGQQGLLQLIQG